jgi:hypothetical protein
MIKIPSNIILLENQLVRYTLAQFDTMKYITSVLGSDVYVQARTDTNTCVLYSVLFDKLKVIM